LIVDTPFPRIADGKTSLQFDSWCVCQSFPVLLCFFSFLIIL